MGIIETAMKTLRTDEVTDNEKKLLELEAFTDHYTFGLLGFRNDLYGIMLSIVDGDHVASVAIADISGDEVGTDGKWLGELTAQMMEKSGINAPRLVAIGLFQGIPRALYTADALGRAYETLAIGPLPLGRGHWGPANANGGKDMMPELYSCARALWGQAWDTLGCWHSEEGGEDG